MPMLNFFMRNDSLHSSLSSIKMYMSLPYIQCLHKDVRVLALYTMRIVFKASPR
jgi:hypothetical protein